MRKAAAPATLDSTATITAGEVSGTSENTTEFREIGVGQTLRLNMMPDRLIALKFKERAVK